jgi:fatty acid desaturase
MPFHFHKTLLRPKPKHHTTGEKIAWFNLNMTIVWAMLLVPTILWWKTSVPWIALISVYANIVGHWSAYQGSRAEVEVERSTARHETAATTAIPPQQSA